MEVISRDVAIERGLKVYFTGEPCKNGHLTYRKVVSRNCSLCEKEYKALLYTKNRERIREEQKQYYLENSDHIKAKVKEYKDSNKDLVNERKRLKREIDPAYGRHDRTFYKNAECSWANPDLLKLAYKTRDERQKLEQTLYNVDHIVPLKHPLVCGLHNEFNLRIITAAENLRKSNKFDPETYRHEDYVSFWDEMNLT
jgi:hypothetical protein